MRRLLVTAAAGALALGLLAPAASATSSSGARALQPQVGSYQATDPDTWTAGELAAQLTFTCVDVAAPQAAIPYAQQGYGGIGFIGSNAAPDVAAQLAKVRAAAAHGVTPIIWSDEEGGEVQRLTDDIYPLPSAAQMGSSETPAQIQAAAKAYGLRMRALGVQMDFAPDTDLDTPGYYIASEMRGFSPDPQTVAADAQAFATGMEEAGITPTFKHWPGHGETGNSHDGIVTTPPLSQLQARDMVPFDDAFAAGAPAVLVGHLVVPGLTETDTTPASESPAALAYLRARTGPDTVIITDSLDMASASSALGITAGEAAVRALVAGADVALSCEPAGVVSDLTAAIDSGRLPRSAAVAKVRRVLAMKAHAGVVPPPTGGRTLVGVQVVGTGVTAGRPNGRRSGRDPSFGVPTSLTPVHNSTGGDVEVVDQSQEDGFRTVDSRSATPLTVTDPQDWQFRLAPYAGDGQQDLYAIHLTGTESGHVEVHVLSEASGYTAYVAHIATAMAAVDPTDWQFQVTSTAGDDAADLVGVHGAGSTGSGHVEVHVLSQASGYQTYTDHAATALALAAPGAWDFLVGDSAGRGDLVAVERQGASGSAEVHVLSHDSGYHAFSLHRALPLAAQPTTTQFSLADLDGDGSLDLAVTLPTKTGSGTTELHVLSGASRFRSWELHTPTALPDTTTPGLWTLQLTAP